MLVLRELVEDALDGGVVTLDDAGRYEASDLACGDDATEPHLGAVLAVDAAANDGHEHAAFVDALHEAAFELLHGAHVVAQVDVVGVEPLERAEVFDVSHDALLVINFFAALPGTKIVRELRLRSARSWNTGLNGAQRSAGGYAAKAGNGAAGANYDRQCRKVSKRAGVVGDGQSGRVRPPFSSAEPASPEHWEVDLCWRDDVQSVRASGLGEPDVVGQDR